MQTVVPRHTRHAPSIQWRMCEGVQVHTRAHECVDTHRAAAGPRGVRRRAVNGKMIKGSEAWGRWGARVEN